MSISASTDGPQRRVLLAIITGVAFFMYGLDSTVVTAAIPRIAESFGVNPIQLSVSIIAYTVSVAVFVPISGWLADRYGASVTFAGAIAVFTLGSLLCALSHDVIELAAARSLQGMGGAMVFPVGRLLILRNIPKSDYIRALAIMGLFPPLGSMLGPPAGGFIVTYISWQWIFLINVPIGMVGLVLVILFVKNYRESERHPLDFTGFVLTGLALSALIYGFEGIGRGEDHTGLLAAAMRIAVCE
jgi:MFS family permease